MVMAEVELDLAGIKARAEAATQERWQECGHDRGGCDCVTVMAPDHPIAVATSGDWGDEYPTLKIEGNSFDRSVTAVMERITYGHVDKAKAKANAAHIAGMDPPTTIALVAEVERLREEVDKLCSVLQKRILSFQKRISRGLRQF